MNGYLRQSTASQGVILGPFLDDTTFAPATGLSIANTDIKIMVNGGTNNNKNSGGGTHRVNGEYSATLDATDTATVGQMKISVLKSGALAWSGSWQVLEEAVYDAMFAASAPGFALTLFTTAMTESYAADGAAPTLAQAIFGILQFLTEVSISGTTWTTKKLNGSTTAMTFTINDATSPTSITRTS
jgi:hypothetical protein